MNQWGSDLGNQPIVGPFFHAAAVTPSDSADLAVAARSLYVGLAGDITVDTPTEKGVLFKSVPLGILPVVVTRVYAAGTAAQFIIALR